MVKGAGTTRKSTSSAPKGVAKARTAQSSTGWETKPSNVTSSNPYGYTIPPVSGMTREQKSWWQAYESGWEIDSKIEKKDWTNNGSSLSTEYGSIKIETRNATAQEKAMFGVDKKYTATVKTKSGTETITGYSEDGVKKQSIGTLSQEVFKKFSKKYKL